MEIYKIQEYFSEKSVCYNQESLKKPFQLWKKTNLSFTYNE